MPKDTWNAEQIARLRLYAGDGLSASEIAAKLGTGHSRSAVIGKAFREHIPLKGRPGASLGQRAVGGQVTRIRAAVTNRRAVDKRQRKIDGSLPGDLSLLDRLEKEPLPSGFLGVSFLDLEEHQCRYPRGEGPNFLCCGQVREGEGPYCTACGNLAYQRGVREVSDEETARRVASSKRRHSTILRLWREQDAA